MSDRDRPGVLSHLLLVGLLGVLAGCTATRGMQVDAPAACHGAAEPFSTYTLAFEDVPGFIEGPISIALRGALANIGLDEAPEPRQADLKVVSTFFRIDRDTPMQSTDPLAESMQTGTTERFLARLNVDVVDQRSDTVIWTGSMYRDHVIQGGETFHGDRAVLLIRQAFDEMFVGLTTPCG
ncbi:MAG: DUF4136 domain-containing protein [Pseudomonadales bacterium]|jgi:hypothetical protein